MIRFTASRRRLLAGFALIGLPVAAIAQSEISGYRIACQRAATVKGVTSSYQGLYDVIGGRFTQDRNPTARSFVPALSAKFAPGGRAMGVATRYEGRVAFLEQSSSFDTTGEKTEHKIYLSFSTAGQTGNGGVRLALYQGKKLVWQNDVSPLSAPTPQIISVERAFDSATSAAIFKKKIRAVVTRNGAQVAEFTFDTAKLNARKYRDANHQSILGKFYSEGALPEGCTKKSTSSSGDSSCFVTTAAVETIGLADDCWELETLRRFRDTALPALPEGRALIADYYARAPQMIARINTRPDARRVWLKTYWAGVVPSALCAAIGWNRAAMACYSRSIRRLERLAA